MKRHTRATTEGGQCTNLVQSADGRLRRMPILPAWIHAKMTNAFLSERGLLATSVATLREFAIAYVKQDALWSANAVADDGILFVPLKPAAKPAVAPRADMPIHQFMASAAKAVTIITSAGAAISVPDNRRFHAQSAGSFRGMDAFASEQLRLTSVIVNDRFACAKLAAFFNDAAASTLASRIFIGGAFIAAVQLFPAAAARAKADAVEAAATEAEAAAAAAPNFIDVGRLTSATIQAIGRIAVSASNAACSPADKSRPAFGGFGSFNNARSIGSTWKEGGPQNNGMVMELTHFAGLSTVPLASIDNPESSLSDAHHQHLKPHAVYAGLHCATALLDGNLLHVLPTFAAADEPADADAHLQPNPIAVKPLIPFHEPGAMLSPAHMIKLPPILTLRLSSGGKMGVTFPITMRVSSASPGYVAADAALLWSVISASASVGGELKTFVFLSIDESEAVSDDAADVGGAAAALKCCHGVKYGGSSHSGEAHIRKLNSEAAVVAFLNGHGKCEFTSVTYSSAPSALSSLPLAIVAPLAGCGCKKGGRCNGLRCTCNIGSRYCDGLCGCGNKCRRRAENPELLQAILNHALAGAGADDAADNAVLEENSAGLAGAALLAVEPDDAPARRSSSKKAKRMRRAAVAAAAELDDAAEAVRDKQRRRNVTSERRLQKSTLSAASAAAAESAEAESAEVSAAAECADSGDEDRGFPSRRSRSKKGKQVAAAGRRRKARAAAAAVD